LSKPHSTAEVLWRLSGGLLTWSAPSSFGFLQLMLVVFLIKHRHPSHNSL